MTAEYKLDLPKLSLETADEPGRTILAKAKDQAGFIPNMYAGMANSPGLLATYLDGYGRFRASSGFTPAEQEVVFLTISRLNGCGYCMAAHSMIARKKSMVPGDTLAAVREDRPISDKKLAALAAFTETMVESRGLPLRAEAKAFLAAGYTERQILEIVLAIAVKTLSNYANHLLHTEIDDVFANYAVAAE